MKPALLSLLLLSTALFAAPKTIRVWGWNTWKRPEHAGDIQRIKPGGEYPHGALRFLPDASKPYSLQAYGQVEAKPDQILHITARFKSSADAGPNATMLMTARAKDAKGNWLTFFKESPSVTLNVVPGTDQSISLMVDLKRTDFPENAAKLGSVCPFLILGGLQKGTVDLECIVVDAAKSTFVPAKAPEGPGLKGYTIQPGAFKHFKWANPLSYEKFARLLDHGALGLNIVELAPAAKAAAWQWPEGDTITAVHANGTWRISAGETPDQLERRLIIPGDKLTCAAHGTGVAFRGQDGKVLLVEGGLQGTGMTLLRANGTPALKVRQIYIADDASQLCWIEEAQRELARARKLYAANLKYLRVRWGAHNGERGWQKNFEFLESSLKELAKAADARAEGFASVLVADPILRDRYAQLIWMAAREYPEDGGYFSGVFRQTWFSHLGGHGAVFQTLDAARKIDRLVAQSRRVANASFQEGADAGGLFSIAWADPLEHIYSKAGATGMLSKECTLELGRGEAEDAQLVLSTAFQPVAGLAVTVTPKTPGAPAVRLYRTEYIPVTETITPQIPLSHAGDSSMPDVLIPLTKPVDLGAYANCAVQVLLRAPRDARPGRYEYTVTVAGGGKSATLPLAVNVHAFTIPERPLPNMAGMRPSSFDTWYPENPDLARRNLSRELLDCLMEPLDLYVFTPIAKDLDWAVANGVQLFNLGSVLHYLAHPEPGMVKYIQLLGSADGKEFTVIPAKAALQPRDPKEPLSDHDLVVTPAQSTAKYRYLKIHYSETRGWSNRSGYTFFTIIPGKGAPVKLTLADGKATDGKAVRFLQPDTNPAKTFAEFKREGSLAFDSLRDDRNRASVLFDTANADIKAIRLVNRHMENGAEAMRKRYQAFKKAAGDKKIPIFAYGYDEVGAHLNRQVYDSLVNFKRLLPDVLSLTSAGFPEAMPEIFKHLDFLCPSNAYALPREDVRINKKYGTRFWTYVGGGGYYPYGNFERVDQPLVNSRAFFWEPITFPHITGFLYWDIHMWRCNNHLKGKSPIDWSLWIPTHGDNNGMGALFYPGENCQAYPSRRAHAMRDGIEDYAAYHLADQLIEKAGNPPALRKRLDAIRAGFATGMSVFNHDNASVHQNRKALYQLLDELGAK